MSSRPMLIGIGGGSGSGKTTLARRVRQELRAETVTVLDLDSYYRDYSHLSQRDRERLNFDHPDAIDWDQVLGDIHALLEWQAIEVPAYDFSSHGRRDETVAVAPAPVVVVEGIHALSHGPLRDMLDIRIFVDTDPDVRFIRRLRRDILNRDRSIDTVVEQYMETVRPMYVDYVEPSRRHADVIVPEGSCNELGIELLVEALVARIERHLAAQPEAT